MYTATILTISDKGARGLRQDTAGPAVESILQSAGYTVVHTAILPDDRARIEAALIESADLRQVNLVLTVGGTGFSPRDTTPEATIAVCERMTPGIPEAMRCASLQLTKRAMLSRAVAGIRKNTLIINLPGSEKAAKENLEAVIDSIAHGLDMLLGTKSECASNPALQ